MTYKLSDLTVPQQKLVQLVHQNLQFGQIESLPIRNGEPDLQEELEVICSKKVFELRATPALPLTEDSELSPKWSAFFAELNQLRNGRIKAVQFRNGAPDSFDTPARLRVRDLSEAN